SAGQTTTPQIPAPLHTPPQQNTTKEPRAAPPPPQLPLVIVAIEPIISPLRKLVPHVEGIASRSNRRIEHSQRIHHTRLVLVPSRRPAVIAPSHNHVELIVVTWPILHR